MSGNFVAFCLTTVVILVAGSCRTTPAVSSSGAQDAAAGSFHTMKPGETVWDLARQSGLSVDEIVEVNGLPSADDVAAGQVLFLPAGGLDARTSPRTSRDAPAERPERAEREATDDDADAAHPRSTATSNPGAIFVWPVEGVVLRDFKPGTYDGVLVAAPASTAVVAAKDGEVVFAGDQRTAYGFIVVVRHDGDLTTIYGHLAAAGVVVKAGDRVKAGERIGVVGTSGEAESPRLHFEVRRGRNAVDPLPLLR